MGVDTHGLEAVRNSAENISGDNPGNTFLKTLNGWALQKIGRKIVRASHSATADNFSYMQGAVTHYLLRVTYTDSTKTDFVSVERIV